MYLSKDQAFQTRLLVLFVGVVTTFALWTPLQDPINVPKMFVLTIGSAWILGTIVVAATHARTTKYSIGQLSVGIFALGLLVSAVLTDVRYTAFYGTYQRNLGAFSYLALATLCLAAMLSFDSTNVKQVRNILLGVGAILTLYGLMQIAGKDPLHWVLTYGPVIGTLGNPDFMSATVGVVAIATAWYVLGENIFWQRAVGAAALIVELYVVRKTGSMQGLLVSIFGISMIALVVLWQRSRKIGISAVVFVGVLFVPTTLGLLNKGPLAAFLYRSSIKNRIDYWHAALSMFKAHPFSGVGLDRFFENYGIYAPQIQVVQGQQTNNAHNVFLQLLATGGLIVILPYLFLLGVIFYSSIRTIKSAKGQGQIDVAALFAIWFALLLISMVSIDNLGVAVWFWISGGTLYGVAEARKNHDVVKPNANKKKGTSKKSPSSGSANYLAPVASLVVAIIVLLLVVPAWRSSAMVADLQANRSRLSPSQFRAKMDQLENMQPHNAQALYDLGDIAMRIKNPELALKYVKEVLEKDPKSNFGNQLGAIAEEAEKKYLLAIPFRKRLMVLDRWNTQNMLQLATDYVQVRDMTNAAAISAKIAWLYSGSADAKTAAALVKG